MPRGPDIGMILLILANGKLSAAVEIAQGTKAQERRVTCHLLLLFGSDSAADGRQPFALMKFSV